MTPQPDKSFREALEEFRKPAPASAWDRIETGLDRRHQNGLWWKIAAGLLLLLAATFVLWPHDKVTPVVTINQPKLNQTEVKGNTTIASSAEVPIVSTAPEQKAEFIPDKKIKTTSLKKGSKPQPDIVDVIEPSNVINAEETVLTTSTLMESMPEPDPEVADASVADATTGYDVNESPGRNMTYTSKEVNARFMKKPVPSDATPQKKSASGVKKVIDVALGLKNNDSIIGDLRQLKNEYLTINFPDKKRDPTK